MEGPPLGPGGEDITWPDQVAPRGRKASSTRKIKPQTSNLVQRVISLKKPHLHVSLTPALNSPNTAQPISTTTLALTSHFCK